MKTISITLLFLFVGSVSPANEPFSLGMAIQHGCNVNGPAKEFAECQFNEAKMSAPGVVVFGLYKGIVWIGDNSIVLVKRIAGSDKIEAREIAEAEAEQAAKQYPVGTAPSGVFSHILLQYSP